MRSSIVIIFSFILAATFPNNSQLIAQENEIKYSGFIPLYMKIIIQRTYFSHEKAKQDTVQVQLFSDTDTVMRKRFEQFNKRVSENQPVVYSYNTEFDKENPPDVLLIPDKHIPRLKLYDDVLKEHNVLLVGLYSKYLQLHINFMDIDGNLKYTANKALADHYGITIDSSTYDGAYSIINNSLEWIASVNSVSEILETDRQDGDVKISREELEKIRTEYDYKIAETAKISKTLKDKAILLKARTARINIQTKLLEERLSILEAVNSNLNSKSAELLEKNHLIIEKDSALQRKIKQTAEQETEIKNQIAVLNNQKAEIDAQRRAIAERQRKIANQSKTIDIHKEEIDRQKTVKYLIGGVGVLFLALAVAIFFFLRKSRRNERELSEKNLFIDRQRSQLKEKNEEIIDSINYAKRIQSAILPTSNLVKEYLANSFVLYKPKDIVAGDFYWMEPQDGRVLFAAADCTGHGVPGAIVSVVCNNGLNRSVREHGLTEPGQILDKTREIVIGEFEKSEEEVKDGMDAALCSLEGNTLKYAGAHNPLWIIRKDTQEVEEIKANKQPIGKYDEPLPYTTHTIELNEGDSFYIFSDGYADQFGGEKGKKFKAANFKRLLLSIQSESMERQRELINEAFEKWRGSLEQLDDVCVIGVRM